MTDTYNQSRGIVAKMLLVMKDVTHVDKDKKNIHANYDYASERIIKATLRDAMIKHGVLLTMSTSNPRMVVVEGGKSVFIIDCEYTFSDSNTKETITGKFCGSGQGRDEKGLYAAITGAIKYVLTTNFLVPTGDDPEDNKFENKPQAPVYTKNSAAISNTPFAKPTDAQNKKIHAEWNDVWELMQSSGHDIKGTEEDNRHRLYMSATKRKTHDLYAKDVDTILAKMKEWKEFIIKNKKPQNTEESSYNSAMEAFDITPAPSDLPACAVCGMILSEKVASYSQKIRPGKSLYCVTHQHTGPFNEKN